MDIPLDPAISTHYLIQFNDGTTKSVPASKMSSFIPKPSANPSDSSHLLPPFLHLNSKITYEHDGQYHKGYLSKSQDGTYRFSYKSHVNKKNEDWGVPLPNLTSNWHELCTEGLLLPSHVSTPFLGLCNVLLAWTLPLILSALSTSFKSVPILSSQLYQTTILIKESYSKEKRAIKSLDA
jgi:hypothetical protein